FRFKFFSSFLPTTSRLRIRQLISLYLYSSQPSRPLPLSGNIWIPLSISFTSHLAPHAIHPGLSFGGKSLEIAFFGLILIFCETLYERKTTSFAPATQPSGHGSGTRSPQPRGAHELRYRREAGPRSAPVSPQFRRRQTWYQR